MTYACRACGIELCDGVEYGWCPRCGGEIDWVDIAVPAPAKVPPPASVARIVFIALVVTQIVLALLDPHGFPYLRWLTFVMQLFAVRALFHLRSLIPEVWALARDRRVRILHGLEHATIRVLEERGATIAEGRTHARSFTIRMPRDKQFEHTHVVVAAANAAIARIARGETRLAYSPQCGTSLVAARLFVALAIVGAGIAAMIGGVPHGFMFAGTVVAVVLADRAARPFGMFAQRAWTVSTAFASARVVRVERWVSPSGESVGFDVYIDVVPRERGGAEPIAVGPL
jgi:uncharacterized protein DUF6391